MQHYASIDYSAFLLALRKCCTLITRLSISVSYPTTFDISLVNNTPGLWKVKFLNLILGGARKRPSKSLYTGCQIPPVDNRKDW